MVFGKAYASQGVDVDNTMAVWRDQVILSGGSLPQYVDLHFHAQGSIEIDGTGAGIIGVGGGNFQSDYVYWPGVRDGFDNPGDWDTLQFGGGFFAGTWHERVFLNGLVGDWYVSYAVQLSPGNLGSVTINGNDPPTFSFTAVTLPDGHTPESEGFTVKFDSGILSPNVANVAAVPEPASLVLFGIGTLGLLTHSWNRRRAARV